MGEQGENGNILQNHFSLYLTLPLNHFTPPSWKQEGFWNPFLPPTWTNISFFPSRALTTYMKTSSNETVIEFQYFLSRGERRVETIPDGFLLSLL